MAQHTITAHLHMEFDYPTNADGTRDFSRREWIPALHKYDFGSDEDRVYVGPRQVTIEGRTTSTRSRRRWPHWKQRSWKLWLSTRRPSRRSMSSCQSCWRSRTKPNDQPGWQVPDAANSTFRVSNPVIGAEALRIAPGYAGEPDLHGERAMQYLRDLLHDIGAAVAHFRFIRRHLRAGGNPDQVSF